MSRIGRFSTTARTVMGPTPYNATAATVSIDVTVGNGVVNLPLAADNPGLAIEVFNPSGGGITVQTQSGDTIRAEGTSFPSGITIPAGASHLYLSDGSTDWHEF